MSISSHLDNTLSNLIKNRKIKIMFTDIWFKDIYNNRFTPKFKLFGFNVEIDTKNPDYVIYSCGGTKYLNYPNAKKD